MTIKVHNPTLLGDQDYLFELGETLIVLFTYIVNSNMSGLLIKNELEYTVTISQNTHLGAVIEFKHDYCFFIS